MQFYLQLNPDNIITDAITYPHGNYVEYESESLPVGVNGGWFKLEGGQIVEYPELKTPTRDDEITQLQQELGMILLESANDKAKISSLEAMVGDLLMEVAALKGGMN